MRDRRPTSWLVRLGILATAAALAFAAFGVPHPGGPDDHGSLAGTPRRTAPGTTFRLASFNVLGAVHTDTGQRPGWANSHRRMAWAVQLIDQNQLQVVGFQEFEAKQYDRFKELTGAQFGVYPGVKLGRRASVQNSIAWRRDTWRLVEAHTIRVPYFHGAMIQMPYVLLQNIATGENVWFYNVPQPRRHPRSRLEVAPRGLPHRDRPRRAPAGRGPVDRRRGHRRQERAREVLLLHGPALGPLLRERGLLEQRPVQPAARPVGHRLADGHLRRPVRLLHGLPRRLGEQDHRPPDRDGDRHHRPAHPAAGRPCRRRLRPGPDLARRTPGRRDRSPGADPDDHRRHVHAERPDRGRTDHARRQRGGHAHRPAREPRAWRARRGLAADDASPRCTPRRATT